MHIRIPIAHGEHDLLHSLPHLFLAARVPGGQLPYSTIHVWLAPESVRPILEEVEVVRIVSFLLHDLELDILVIQVGIKSPGSFFVGKMKLAGEEEAGNLARSQVVTQLKLGLGMLKLFDVQGNGLRRQPYISQIYDKMPL